MDDKKEIILEKRIPNEGGDILVRPYPHNEGKEYYEGMPIIEALHLWNGDSGCAIVFWELRKSDGDWIIEAREIHDRITSTKFDEGVMEEMFFWGRKLSNIMLDFMINNLPHPTKVNDL